MMKKSMLVLFMTVSCAFLFSVTADQLSDKIELGRLGGTTRVASATVNNVSGLQFAPIVEAFNAQNVISLSVQNYRGGVWVEVIAPREVRQSYIEVYDMGFGVVNLAGLRAGQYTLRITVGSEIYTGTFKVASYGR